MIESFEIKGEWKFAIFNEWLKGPLTYDNENGASLVLHGTFNHFLLDRSSKEIILGKTIEGEVTLIDSLYVGSRTHNPTGYYCFKL